MSSDLMERLPCRVKGVILYSYGQFSFSSFLANNLFVRLACQYAAATAPYLYFSHFLRERRSLVFY